MDGFYRRIEQSVGYLKARVRGPLKAAVILGSGLAGVADQLGAKETIPYGDIPGFPPGFETSGLVQGHKGELLFGEGTVIFNGRFHYYQGYPLSEVTFPVRISKRLGARVLVVTNASGGINRRLRPGSIMLITDHINCLGSNPLVGADPGEFGPPFVDMSEPYSRALVEKAREISRRRPDIGRLAQGVYLATTGPSYETKAEIAFFRRIGADAVGMSTVPEVIVAAQEGMGVLGVSVIANMACGITKRQLSHAEVLSSVEKASRRVGELIRAVLEAI